MSEGLLFLMALALYLSVQAGADLRVPLPTPQPAPAATDSVPVAVDAVLYEQGKHVYLTQYCGVCHTLAAAETRGNFGPAHDGLARVAADHLADPRYRGAATTVPDYIRESILEPGVFLASGGGIGRQAMPPFGHLPAADIDALVYFLSQQQ